MRTSVAFALAAFALAPLVALGGCSAGSSSSSTPPAGGSAGASAAGGPARSGPLDYSGVWQVSGTDAARGAYAGTAEVLASGGSTYTIRRLVTYTTPAASGREVVSAWNATGAPEAGGLRLRATLRRANVVKRAGSQTRAAADRQPLAVDALLAPPGGGAVSQIGYGTSLAASLPGTSLGAGLTETWTLSPSLGAPAFPSTDVTSVPLHSPPSSGVRNTMFAVFSAYQGLPAIAPYTSRADFKAAIHSVPVDRTARDWYRANGPGAAVVLDEVVDDISVLEEGWRADAFGRSLHEKAASFDAEMESAHLDASGMIANLRGGAAAARDVSGDGALHLGCYVASQVFRYQATGDAQAFANVELGLKALLACVDICPDKTQFARAVDGIATAPSGWTPGTGAYANLAWLPGGNNDMLHGIEYGFLAAEQILPAGHPLRAQLGAQSRSLIDNVSIAKSGSHFFILAEVCWRTTGDASVFARYQSEMRGDTTERLWTQSGNGILNQQGIADWSGHHLGTLTFCCLRILGGASPDADEQGWRGVGSSGAWQGFLNMRAGREGLLDVAAGAAGSPDATADAKDVLAEIPYPKPTGDADISRDVTADYSVSPYPSDPWKNDWMTNAGRVQALTGMPIFYRGSDENYWARSALPTGGAVVGEAMTSQDFLHAYWLGRVTGVISASD